LSRPARDGRGVGVLDWEEDGKGHVMRALVSIPLNVAEGAYSRGRNRQARFQSATASARETLACFETAEAMGFVGPLDPELGARMRP
jgi:hypothetical protein